MTYGNLAVFVFGCDVSWGVLWVLVAYGEDVPLDD